MSIEMSIEGTILEKILEEQRQTNSLLLVLIETIEQGKKTVGSGGKGSISNLSDEEKADLEDEIDLNWWFLNYGEESLPAKYMCVSAGIPASNTNPYAKDENEFIFNRLMDFVEEENEEGTHIFKYLGKVWCKREGNARNCFSFLPIKKES